jgi:hypothetical protein
MARFNIWDQPQKTTKEKVKTEPKEKAPLEPPKEIPKVTRPKAKKIISRSRLIDVAKELSVSPDKRKNIRMHITLNCDDQYVAKKLAKTMGVTVSEMVRILIYDRVYDLSQK